MKKIVLFLTVLFVLSTATACSDYEYNYNFSVQGGNGKLYAICGDKEIYESPIVLMGGKRGNHQLKFIAVPDEGFQVKQWIYNGKIAEDYKLESFTTGLVSYNDYISVSVEFELVGN